jgi:hypothetical protein
MKNTRVLSALAAIFGLVAFWLLRHEQDQPQGAKAEVAKEAMPPATPQLPADARPDEPKRPNPGQVSTFNAAFATPINLPAALPAPV